MNTSMRMTINNSANNCGKEGSASHLSMTASPKQNGQNSLPHPSQRKRRKKFISNSTDGICSAINFWMPWLKTMQEKPLTENPRLQSIFLNNIPKMPVWRKMPIFSKPKISTTNLFHSRTFIFSVPKENGPTSIPTKVTVVPIFTNFHKNKTSTFVEVFLFTVFSDTSLLFLSDDDICLWAGLPVSGRL